MNPVTRLILSVAAVITAFPAQAGSSTQAVWVEICSGHDVRKVRLPIRREAPQPDGEGVACHAACTLPRKRSSDGSSSHDG